MLRIVPPTVPRVGRSGEHFPDGFELHLLRVVSNCLVNRHHQTAIPTFVVCCAGGAGRQITITRVMHACRFSLERLRYLLTSFRLDLLGGLLS